MAGKAKRTDIGLEEVICLFVVGFKQSVRSFVLREDGIRSFLLHKTVKEIF